MRLNTITRICSFLLIGLAVSCLAVAAEAQTFSVLYTFSYPGPTTPASGVTIDAGGNLYGTTLSYLANSIGAAYRLSQKNGAWVLSPLVSFNRRNGNTPLARPIFGPDGRLYGTTEFGGTGCDLGCGNVYSLYPPTTFCRTVLCYWTVASIYDFGSMPDDGAGPGNGDLLFDAAGNIYGTTSSNALGSNLYYGTVFELSNSQGVWSETILHQFGPLGGSDGVAPESSLLRDQEGNLYGTTAEGGTNLSCNYGRGCGIVYQLSPSGSGWSEQVLYTFQGQNDGDTPIGGLVMDAAGNLYGTTSQDGANGGGTVFELSPSNGAWSLTTLYSFTKSANDMGDCIGPMGTLVLDSTENLYGTTCGNGAYGYGALFKLTNLNGNWVYSSLHDFTNGDDGANPIGSPSFDHSGNIYGTASSGGAFKFYGTVWKLTP
ncbi:MAG TPA: choice-of-anchor tandem repeat GloVer-containing protein [Terriglobales bacterium]|nr:choice-of-anchor tandem repeat GloVer-containing protein [Terriglobales bacterium]